MKKVVDGKNPNTKDEIVPIQDFIELTVEGIPQEVIDEMYDVFDDVNYDTYKKRPPKKIEVYVADYYDDLEVGEFQFQDEQWNVRKESGTLRQRYNIVGEKKRGNVFDLFTVYSYNTIIK